MIILYAKNEYNSLLVKYIEEFLVLYVFQHNGVEFTFTSEENALRKIIITKQQYPQKLLMHFISQIL